MGTAGAAVTVGGRVKRGMLSSDRGGEVEEEEQERVPPPPPRRDEEEAVPWE